MRSPSVSGFRRRFQRLFRIRGQVAHVLLTLPPLGARGRPVRLACLIHAASVHSEPGSNSPSQKWKGSPGTPEGTPGLTCSTFNISKGALPEPEARGEL